LSYLGAGAGGGISRETLELLAQLVRMPLAAEDADALAAAVVAQLASIEQIDRLDLDDVQPALGFDPRWDD
jgi:Asp-tRNA(Asn)/Glu-tRNA(Gln) amidotransferase C subunit